MSNRYPETRAVLVEAKVNGPAVIKMLNRRISGLIPIDPKDYGGDKVARLRACVPEFAAGNVYLPDPALYPWVKEFVKELTLFPKSAYKDQVDTCSQALNWLAENGGRIVSLQPKEQPHSKSSTQEIFSSTAVGVKDSTRAIRSIFS